MRGRLRNFKETKHSVVIYTNKNLNTPALKCYIACFNISLHKRDISWKMVSDIMGHPIHHARVGIIKSATSSSLEDTLNLDQSDQGLHCLPFKLDLSDKYMVITHFHF